MHTLALRLLVVLLGLTFWPMPAPAAQPPDTPAAQRTFAQRLAARCRAEMSDQRLVGLSVAIAGTRGIMHVDHFGFEDRERRIAASDRTMYRWASVSKPLTAVVAMQLARDKRLDLEADVRALVPEFPDKGRTITPRLLLTHQGGIVHYSNGPVIRTIRTYDSTHPFQDAILALDTFKDSPLVCEPGEKHSYTTHGYLLLGAVIQRAGGKPYWDLVRERVCLPLGLETLRPDYQWERIEHRAVGYVKQRDADAILSTDTDVSWKLPGGGFISTARDMALFGAGLLDERLLDAPTKAAMWTRQATRDGVKTGYALGWSIGRIGGRVTASHSGSQEKTATQLLIVPPSGSKPGFAAAVLSNTQGAELADLVRDIMKMTLDEHAGADAGAAEPDEAPMPPAPAR
ncbi:MAG: serine hydrolase domain-containing protein [Phycisphaerales bacterium]